MRRRRTRVGLTLFCLLFCLFSIGGGGFDGAREAAASSIRSCANADEVTGMARGSVNPDTGLCGGIEMTSCGGWSF